MSQRDGIEPCVSITEDKNEMYFFMSPTAMRTCTCAHTGIPAGVLLRTVKFLKTKFGHPET